MGHFYLGTRNKEPEVSRDGKLLPRAYTGTGKVIHTDRGSSREGLALLFDSWQCYYYASRTLKWLWSNQEEESV